MSDEPQNRPDELHEEKKSSCRLGLISLLLLLLIAAVVYYFYLKRRDPDFHPSSLVIAGPKGDPATLGRQVTFFSLSPLTSTYCTNGGGVPEGLRSTLYTKIGSKAVRAAGEIDIRLYEYDTSAPEGKGRQVCAWSDVKLPDSAKWGSWPLGGWNVALTWTRCPPTKRVCLEAIYTNPVGKIFRAQQGPIRIAG